MSGSIGGVDASIPLSAGKGVAQPANPLQMVGNYANIQGALLRNQLIPGELQLQQLAINKGNLGQTLDRMNAVRNAGAALAGKSNLTPDDIYSFVGSLQAAGMPTEEMVNFMHQNMPTQAGPELNKWIARNFLGPLMPAAAVPQNMQAPGTRSNGLEIQSGSTSGIFSDQPVGTFNQTGSTTQVYPSRSERMAPVHWLDKDTGATVYGTQEEYAQLTGSGHNLGPLEQGGPPAQDGGTSFPKGFNGRPNVQPARQGATSEQPPAQQQAQSQPGQGAPMQGPSPGMPELIAKNRQDYGKDQTEAGNFASRTLPLKQMIPLLGQTTTGPGSETLNHVRSFLIGLNQNHMWPNALTPDAPAQAVYDELHKYMANAVTGMPFAAGSVPALAQAVSANPNTNLSTMANSDLAKVLLGLERYKQAQYLYFNQKHAANPNEAAGNYDAEKAEFATKYDPRAFAMDLMEPNARAKLYNSMSPAEKEKFKASVKLAYSLPDLMN